MANQEQYFSCPANRPHNHLHCSRNGCAGKQTGNCTAEACHTDINWRILPVRDCQFHDIDTMDEIGEEVEAGIKEYHGRLMEEEARALVGEMPAAEQAPSQQDAS